MKVNTVGGMFVFIYFTFQFKLLKEYSLYFYINMLIIILIIIYYFIILFIFFKSYKNIILLLYVIT